MRHLGWAGLIVVVVAGVALRVGPARRIVGALGACYI